MSEGKQTGRKLFLALIIAALLLVVAIPVTYLFRDYHGGWQCWSGIWTRSHGFTGQATAGTDRSPDGRWTLKLVWVDDGGTVDAHLHDSLRDRDYVKRIVIRDPECHTVNQEGDQRVDWEVVAPQVLIGSETIRLPR